MSERDPRVDPRPGDIPPCPCQPVVHEGTEAYALSMTANWRESERQCGILRAKNEQLTVQLAGCSVAAEGGTKDPATREQWGWSPAYQEVMDLRIKYDTSIQDVTTLRTKLHEAYRELYDVLRARDAVVILLRAKTDDVAWAKYPDSIQDAVDAEYAKLRAEIERLRIIPDAMDSLQLDLADALRARDLEKERADSNYASCQRVKGKFEEAEKVAFKRLCTIGPLRADLATEKAKNLAEHTAMMQEMINTFWPAYPEVEIVAGDLVATFRNGMSVEKATREVLIEDNARLRRDMDALNAAREKAEAALTKEHECRVKYQDIVYATCNKLDQLLGYRPGSGILATKENIEQAIAAAFVAAHSK
jgi:hypothetical protein